MRTQSRTQRISKLALLSVLLALPIFTGSPFCSSEDKETEPPPPPSRSTIDALLTNWFERAYNNQDSILYEEMLADTFQFEFLEVDAQELRDRGILGPGENFWGKTLDLGSTSRMFRSDNVTSITLDLVIDSTSPYTGIDCNNCTDVLATVTLRVGTITPTDPERILAVDSKQNFIVKPDPADPTQWVIYRQIDSDLPAKQASDVASALP